MASKKGVEATKPTAMVIESTFEVKKKHYYTLANMTKAVTMLTIRRFNIIEIEKLFLVWIKSSNWLVILSPRELFVKAAEQSP